MPKTVVSKCVQACALALALAAPGLHSLARDMTLFGAGTLGKPLKLPPCPADNAPVVQLCVIQQAVSNPGAGEQMFWLHFPARALPAYMRSDEPRAAIVTRAGKVYSLSFSTNGHASNAQVLQLLQTELGDPTSRQTGSHVGSTSGSETVTTTRWDRGAVRALYSVSNRGGRVTLYRGTGAPARP